MTDDNWQPNRKQQALIERMARFPYPKMAEAARALDIAEQTARRWNTISEFKAALRCAYAEDARQTKDDLDHRIQAAGGVALAVKLNNLKADSAHVRHLESSWLLERILGKTPDKHEISGTDGGPVQLTPIAAVSGLTNDELDRGIANLKRQLGLADGAGDGAETP